VAAEDAVTERRLRSLGALLIGSVIGCSSSSEGSRAAQGSSTGSTPQAGDADGDYLPDDEEVELGTDPHDPDTDGDTYLDGDEVLEQTDPLDPESRIYRGGWPYQRLKDQIADPGFDGTPMVGGVIPRLVAFDQFGDELDLYDFALHGRRVVIDLSALWCGACKDLAAWLGGEPSMLDAKTELSEVPNLVNSGRIHWITVLFEDAFGNAAGPEQAVAWAEAFPNPQIAIVADNDRIMYDFLFPGSFPSIQVLDEDMTLRVYDRFDYEGALQFLLENN
jgi:hypothetical protein